MEASHAPHPLLTSDRVAGPHVWRRLEGGPATEAVPQPSQEGSGEGSGSPAPLSTMLPLPCSPGEGSRQ